MKITKPYLIQRAKINSKRSNEDRLSNAVNFDYMGSAEFEFGALPKSFREMFAKKESLKIHVINKIKEDRKPLIVYGSFDDEMLQQYVEWILCIKNNDRSIRLKENPHFNDSKTDFWWDIDNGVMFSFNESFMRELPNYVKNSWSYMKLV